MKPKLVFFFDRRRTCFFKNASKDFLGSSTDCPAHPLKGENTPSCS
jgi:hypothetical protein